MVGVHVVSRRRVWLVGVGGIYGCGYWVLFCKGYSVCCYVAIHTMVNFSYRFCKLVFFYFLRSHRTRN